MASNTPPDSSASRSSPSLRDHRSPLLDPVTLHWGQVHCRDPRKRRALLSGGLGPQDSANTLEERMVPSRGRIYMVEDLGTAIFLEGAEH
jgi:hypothetical protein